MRIAKLVRRMAKNPQSITRFEELKAVADHFGLDYREAGEHFWIFERPGRFKKVTIPRRRGIKWKYVEQFFELIEDLVPPHWLED